MKMELTEGSETSAYINQTPGNYPKGNLLYSVHGESLKSRKANVLSKARWSCCRHSGSLSPPDYDFLSFALLEASRPHTQVSPDCDPTPSWHYAIGGTNIHCTQSNSEYEAFSKDEQHNGEKDGEGSRSGLIRGTGAEFISRDKNTRKINRENPYQGRDLKLRSPKYKVGMLTTRPRRRFHFMRVCVVIMISRRTSLKL